MRNVAPHAADLDYRPNRVGVNESEAVIPYVLGEDEAQKLGREGLDA